MCKWNTGVGVNGESGGDAGDKSVGDVFAFEAFDFFAGSGEDRRVTTFESNDALSEAGMFDDQVVDFGLFP